MALSGAGESTVCQALFAALGLAIIDFLAVAPFYFSPIFPFDTRVLRGLRLLQLFKLARYSHAMEWLVTGIRKRVALPQHGSTCQC